MAVPHVDLSAIHHPIVKSAIEAMNAKDQQKWYQLFSDTAALTDDGTPHDFRKWCDRELFGSSVAYLASVDKTEDGGLTVYGQFHSDRWGDFRTYFKFSVEDQRITRLAVGQVSD